MTGASSRRELRVCAARCAAAGALLAMFVALAGCGQRGPLELPDSARPIERLDPATQPPAAPGASSPTGVAQPAPGAASGITPPAQREPRSDDESDNKARRPENEP